MKKGNLVSGAVLAAILHGCVAVAATAYSAPLTSLRSIHALTNEKASLALPVAFEASVTYYKEGDVDLFVQEGDDAIYVETMPRASLMVGDRVLVTGTTRASFRPEVKGDTVTVLRHGVAPDPIAASFKQLIRADLDCKRVSVHAIVRSANVVMDGGLQNLYLQLLMDGGNIDAEVIDSDSRNPERLLDAEVDVTGAVAGRFDGKMQMTGILLEVASLSDLKVTKLASVVPKSLPPTPMDEILKGFDIQDRTRRIRVQGSITYYQPGSTIVLQSGDKSIWALTQFEKPLRVGDSASVTGFPDVHNGSLTLTRAEIEDSGVLSPVTPLLLTAKELALGSHAFDLVSVQGRLVMAVREAEQDEYVLISRGQLFSAVYRHPSRGLEAQLSPFHEIPLGSTVRMTGICFLDNGDKFLGPVAFDVLLRTSGDIALVAGPPLLNVKNLIILVGLLLLIVFAIGARAWGIERRVRYQNARLASIEKRRAQILEDINSMRPLSEIIEDITELAGFKLNGATCWCDLVDGAKLGNRPHQLNDLRTVQSQVSSHCGSALGTVSAAFHRLTKPSLDEVEALRMAAGLIALAIETRVLYSDLRHRSEFDLLTDIHNRFSLEKRLDELIQNAQTESDIFGIIYVDLDGFKQINDSYGHMVGDIYLQTVAQRMKRQIRPADILARLGGDEFAVLVPHVRYQKDVEEIALRIQHCFETQFAIDGVELKGSASLGIAVYPIDGTTRDKLLNAADAAMYVAKHTKRQFRDIEQRGEDSCISRTC
jgi:diguanylate cyclase (GGDEF)-like protein